MANVIELQKTLKYLKSTPESNFDMRYCVLKAEKSVSTFCIAGLVLLHYGFEEQFLRRQFPSGWYADSLINGDTIIDTASCILDLSPEESIWLFLGYFSPNSMHRIKKKEAIKAIKHLISSPGNLYVLE